MADDSNVFLFPKAKDEAITADVVQKPHDYKDCRHEVQLVLDVQAHQLICPACNQVLDCFDWIRKRAGDWAYQNTRYRQARQQAAEAEKELARLERLKKNARASIRRGGLSISSKGAHAAYKQLQAVTYALNDLIRRTDGDATRATRQTLALFGYDPGYVRMAMNELHQVCNLEGDPAELPELTPA